MNDTQDILNYYGEQLESIKAINKSLKRDNGFLICMVISMAILLSTYIKPDWLVNLL